MFKDKISPLIYVKGSIKQDHNSIVGKPNVKEQIYLYFLLVQTNRPVSLLFPHVLSPQLPTVSVRSRICQCSVGVSGTTLGFSPDCSRAISERGFHRHFVLLRDKQSPRFSQINKMVGKVLGT